ncbi:hypothetical protein NQ314_014364 [Rhamnusium bicolor]|uniref:Uncharacterized protein n=1 Tax=Rhamnusium bicolor TaxID=1586634 RepID=A0AAV8X2A7_9CUCU|nr:hypothetical protein NQ314_014364 [Rhamnusium bicolor]
MINNEEPVVPVKKARKIKKEILIRQKKVKGEAHINHKGRVIEAKKVGPDCKCKRYKCFSVITDKIKETDIEGVLCNSNKKPPGQSLSRARLRCIQNSLAHTNGSPLDKRGQHQNRPNKTSPELDFLIQQHIKSFPARQSHYSIRKNPQRFYLHETLTVKETYRSAYQELTCTMYDMLRQKIEANKNEQEGKKLAAEKELHLWKAEAFYSLKRKWKQEAHTNKATVISFDFMQNLNESIGRKATDALASTKITRCKRKEKVTVETPQEWDAIMVTCRLKPSPFDVITLGHEADVGYGTKLKFQQSLP